MKGESRKLIVSLLALVMMLSQLTFFSATVDASDFDLIITGEGIYEDISIATDDWSKYKLKEQYFSTNNSLNFHKISKVKGYDLFELIGKDNLKKDKDYVVKFTALDGFEFTKTISELKNTYYYSDFTESSKTISTPMIANYSGILADFPKDSFSPPVFFKDRPLTEKDLEKGFPKIVFGQTSIDDMNMSKWGKEIAKITIGEDRKVITQNFPKDKSSYKHISFDGAPYNIDAITSATLTIEGPALEGYRAISLRQIEEDLEGITQALYFENIDGKVVQNSYEGVNAKYLIENYVSAKPNAGNIVFKNKSRKTILTCSIDEAYKYTIAYGINQVPLVFLDSDVGYKLDKYNDNGCFKLVYEQGKEKALEFSNVAYIYVEEKDAKNIYEHTYAPYNDLKYFDYELIIHGDALDKKVRYTVSQIETMKDISHEAEYSLSNSEYFWYYNTYKGVKVWDLLLESGLDPNIDENTSVRFIAADNYNFAPMTIKEIKDNSLYGYYEKDPTDKGDGSFDGKEVEALYTDMPILVAYGFNKYPYVTRPTDEGYNPGLGNDGGPLRVIFGKTNYNDANGGNQVQFLKEIIIGKGESIATDTAGTGYGDITQVEVDKNFSWNHNQGAYNEYLDMPVLRVTGSQVKEPMTFTLRQIEAMNEYALRDIYSGDGIHEFEGIRLWDIISKKVGLKKGVDTPSIRVFSGQNYNQILRSNEQVVNGVLNSKGQLKDIILAYAMDNYPLVPNEGSTGYVNNNAHGPLRLIIEENKSMWVKWTDCIVVGTGDYEAPIIEDVKDMDMINSNEEVDTPKEADIFTNKTILTYTNDTGKELPEASIRTVEYDKYGNLWVGTNNGGISVRTPKGKWTLLSEIKTINEGVVNIDTSYAIVQRENGDLWIALGGATTPQGILVKSSEGWSLINKDNSELPNNFVQELELDGNGGVWIGTGNGLAHADKDNNWTIFTRKEGLALDSIDAIETDSEGGVWVGFYPETQGKNEDVKYIGAYQYLDKDGNITTYDGFDIKNFNVNWVRSISMDNEGGVWIVRSGNAPGFGHGVVDFIKDGNRTTYSLDELIPNIGEDDDIRFIEIDMLKEFIYIGTKSSGVLVSDKIGSIIGSLNSSSYLPNNKWNNVYYLNVDKENLFIGTNGGVAIFTEKQNQYEFMSTIGEVVRKLTINIFSNNIIGIFK